MFARVKHSSLLRQIVFNAAKKVLKDRSLHDPSSSLSGAKKQPALASNGQKQQMLKKS
jgi:hypothetical protein